MVTLEDARRSIAAAEKKAKEIGQPMNIAVADEGGNLISHVRMDGAWLGSVDISINKAWTARSFDIATKDLADNSQPVGPVFQYPCQQWWPSDDLRGWNSVAAQRE